MHDTERLIRAYYDAFNAGDVAAFLTVLTDDVVHDISQGGQEIGKPAFAAFLARMNRCYREQVTDVVVMIDPTGTRAAAEFVVNGTYIATDEGLPHAHGQAYILPAGAFFSVRDGKIARISNHYNLPDWIDQVSI